MKEWIFERLCHNRCNMKGDNDELREEKQGNKLKHPPQPRSQGHSWENRSQEGIKRAPTATIYNRGHRWAQKPRKEWSTPGTAKIAIEENSSQRERKIRAPRGHSWEQKQRREKTSAHHNWGHEKRIMIGNNRNRDRSWRKQQPRGRENKSSHQPKSQLREQKPAKKEENERPPQQFTSEVTKQKKPRKEWSTPTTTKIAIERKQQPREKKNKSSHIISLNRAS